MENSTDESNISYAKWDARVRYRHSVVGCMLVIVLMPVGLALDWHAYPMHFWNFLYVRLVCDVAVLAVLLSMVVDRRKRYIYFLGALWPVIVGIALCYMIAVTGGSKSDYHMALVLLMAGVSLLMPWTFLEIASISAALLVMYIAGCIYGGLSTSEFVNNFFFLSMVAVICSASGYFSHKNRRQEFGLRQKVIDRNEELTESYRQLAKMEEAKSRFLANISHELRTPLTVIIAPLEDALRADDLPHELRRPLVIAHSNAMRLLKLINDLLESMRLDAGAVEIHCQPVDLRMFLAAQVESMSYLAKVGHVDLVYDEPSVPIYISADITRLERIIVNLLGNALKFTRPGGNVRVGCDHREGEAIVTVSDSGIGIPEEKLDSIFERFQQVDDSSTREFQGAGIGLSLVKELTQRHQGTITVTSELGKGSCFTLRFPEITPSSEELADQRGERGESSRLVEMYRQADARAGTEVAQSSASLTGDQRKRDYTVLVVDDEPDMREYLVSMMAQYYQVESATDGRSGLERVRNGEPDLVLVDMMMPGMNGLDFCRAVRQELGRSQVRIIMLTARTDNETKIAVLGSGANDFLNKPFSVMELHARVHNHLQSYGLQLALQRQNRELDAALNQLRATEEQLIQSEKVNALGVMAAGILHEVNNPLNYALTALGFARSLVTESHADLRETLGDIDEGMQRIRRITTDLQAFAHPKAGLERGTSMIREVLESTVRLCGHDMKHIDVSLHCPEDVRVTGSKEHLSQVFVNVLSNAGRAVREQEHPVIRIDAETQGDALEVRIADNGVGISEDAMNKIFDPFFTKSDIGDGTGLGLSICRTILGQCGGTIEAESDGHSGATFIIRLRIFGVDDDAEDAAEEDVMDSDVSFYFAGGLRDHPSTKRSEARR